LAAAAVPSPRKKGTSQQERIAEDVYSMSL